MKRTCAHDVLVCSRCGGDLRLIAVVQDAAACETILRHLGLWTRGPPRDHRVVLDPTAFA